MRRWPSCSAPLQVPRQPGQGPVGKNQEETVCCQRFVHFCRRPDGVLSERPLRQTPPQNGNRASATAPTASRKFINSVFIRREGMLRQEKTKVELLADWFGSLERCQTSVARPCSSPIDSERKGRITRMQIRPRLALPEINDPQVISAAPVVYFASAFHLLWLTRADFLGRWKSVADSSPSLTTISRQTMKMVNAPMDSVGFRSACLVQKEAKFSGG